MRSLKIKKSFDPAYSPEQRSGRKTAGHFLFTLLYLLMMIGFLFSINFYGEQPSGQILPGSCFQTSTHGSTALQSSYPWNDCSGALHNTSGPFSIQQRTAGRITDRDRDTTLRKMLRDTRLDSFLSFSAEIASVSSSIRRKQNTPSTLQDTLHQSLPVRAGPNA